MRCLLFAMVLSVASSVAGCTPSNYRLCDTYGDWNEIVSGCSSFIAEGGVSDYNLAAAHHNRGTAYENLGQCKLAIEDFNVAISLLPGSPHPYLNRGHALASLGNYPPALEDFERSMKLEGAPRVRFWQTWTRSHGGYYTGPINGVYDPEILVAIEACLRDQACRDNEWTCLDKAESIN